MPRITRARIGCNWLEAPTLVISCVCIVNWVKDGEKADRKLVVPINMGSLHVRASDQWQDPNCPRYDWDQLVHVSDSLFEPHAWHQCLKSCRWNQGATASEADPSHACTPVCGAWSKMRPYSGDSDVIVSSEVSFHALFLTDLQFKSFTLSLLGVCSAEFPSD